jgi:hypothetical protein
MKMSLINAILAISMLQSILAETYEIISATDRLAKCTLVDDKGGLLYSDKSGNITEVLFEKIDDSSYVVSSTLFPNLEKALPLTSSKHLNLNENNELIVELYSIHEGKIISIFSRFTVTYVDKFGRLVR